MLMRALVIAALSLSSASVMAEADVETGEDRVVHQKITVLDFSQVKIRGELTRPSSTYFVGRKQTRFRNMIELRATFRPEMEKSVSGL